MLVNAVRIVAIGCLIFLLSGASLSYYCGKPKVISATSQRIIPGIQKVKTTIQYTFKIRKPLSTQLEFHEVWIKTSQEGVHHSFELQSIDNQNKAYPSQGKGIKEFQLLVNEKISTATKVSNVIHSSPLKNFDGDAYITYSINSNKAIKHLKVPFIKSLKDVRKR